MVAQIMQSHLSFLWLEVDVAHPVHTPFAARREPHDQGALDGLFQLHIFDTQHYSHRGVVTW